jgi:tetratricopeptide (TPR) repeat protein
MAEHLEFPGSGRFLGFFVDLLRLRQQPGSTLSSGTDRRQDDEYLRGGPVTSDRAASLQRRARVRSQMAETLVESRLVPDWPTPPGRRSAQELLVDAIDDVAHLVDEVYGSMTANRGIEVPVRLAARPLLRLLAIDLGVRLGGLCYLSGWRVPVSQCTRLAAPGGAGSALREMLLGVRDLDRAKFTKAVCDRVHEADDQELGRSTVGRWFDGSERPSPRHLEAVAQVLATSLDRDEDELLRELDRNWIVAELAQRLRRGLTTRDTELLVSAVLHYAEISRVLAESVLPDDQARVRFAEELVRLGTRSSDRSLVCSALRRTEPDPIANEMMPAAFQDWRPFLALMLSCYERFDLEGVDTKSHPALDPVLQLEACFLGPPENAAAEIPRLDKRGAALYAVEHALTHGANALAKRAGENALSRWPNDPLVLCEVGICFAEIGLRERARECLSKSHEMVLGYGVAGLALGRLLLDGGDADGAVRVLEDMNERLGSDARADACELIGVAHLRRGDPERAEAALERAIEILPESPLAWALRSRIAESSGRGRDATTYRSIAERLGLRVRPS